MWGDRLKKEKAKKKKKKSFFKSTTQLYLFNVQTFLWTKTLAPCLDPLRCSADISSHEPLQQKRRQGRAECGEAHWWSLNDGSSPASLSLPCSSSDYAGVGQTAGGAEEELWHWDLLTAVFVILPLDRHGAATRCRFRKVRHLLLFSFCPWCFRRVARLPVVSCPWQGEFVDETEDDAQQLRYHFMHVLSMWLRLFSCFVWSVLVNVVSPTDSSLHHVIIQVISCANIVLKMLGGTGTDF